MAAADRWHDDEEVGEQREGDRDEPEQVRGHRRDRGDWDDEPPYGAALRDMMEGATILQGAFLRATAEVLRGLAAAADHEATRRDRERRRERNRDDGGHRPRPERIYPE